MAKPLLRALYRNVVPGTLKTRIDAARQHARHRSAANDPDYQRSLARLDEMRDRHAGDTCIVIGNGPSMSGFDLARLSGIPCFCLNRGYLLWTDQGLTPDYLVTVNRLVIEQFHDEIAAVAAQKFAPWLLRDHFGKAADEVVFFEERWDDAFHTDARHGLASQATVTNTTLQLAYHMGFSTVILLGIDHHFTASAGGDPHQMIVQKSGDADHFRPDYFAPGTRWHLPDLVMSERGYLRARDAFQEAGRRVINATPGTRLDVFEKKRLDDILAARTAGSRKDRRGA